MSGEERTLVDVDGHTLSLSNLDKVMYPAAHFTKADVIDYYRRIAPLMLPHLAGRPITLVRFPNGVNGQSFFEKNCPSHRPPWVETVDILTTGRRSGKNREELIHFCLLASPADLVWTANLAALELHPGLQTKEELGRPTCVVFDLDPGEPADVVTCAEVARMIREVLDHLGLQAVVKTSGSKGLQLYVPLNTTVDFEQTKDFALALGQLLEREHPTLVTTNMNKAERPGRVFVDWSQNTFFKTTVAVYSLRARERPTASTPVTWDEIEAATTADDLRFESHEVLARVEEHGDLFEPLLKLEQDLPSFG